MIHQPIKLPPPSRHPMAQPAPDGWLRDLVLHARTPAVRDRLDVAIYVAAGLLVALIASGYLRAALAGRL
ncbi:MAG: hypothetical protein ACRYGP_09500 [Janthinobacterium lividum]